jgi:DNA-binding response OmpR family regulator/HPt (histidine-containing phosphotransfer) domain-containing protein
VAEQQKQGLDASIARLWEGARTRALARVELIEDAVAALLGTAPDVEQGDAARREAHKLAGSLGTFGMPKATEHARAIERAFEAGAATEDVPALAGHVAELRRIVTSGPDAQPPGVPAGARDVVLVGVTAPREAEVIRALAERGIAAGAADAEAGAPVALAGGAASALADRVERLAARGARVAAIVPADPAVDRVELVRRGSVRLLPEMLSSEELADELESLVAGGRRTAERVLLVDDDPDVLARARDVLVVAGHAVTTVDHPLGFWPALERTAPDLVVLDVDMPGTDGISLCRTLRADAQWAATPVVFLTGSSAPETVAELFAAGADDYVAKPFAGPELVARIGNRLERARLLRAATTTDSVSGLELRGPAHARLRRLRGHADRLGEPLTLGVLTLALPAGGGAERPAPR